MRGRVRGGRPSRWRGGRRERVRGAGPVRTRSALAPCTPHSTQHLYNEELPHVPADVGPGEAAVEPGGGEEGGQGGGQAAVQCSTGHCSVCSELPGAEVPAVRAGGEVGGGPGVRRLQSADQQRAGRPSPPAAQCSPQYTAVQYPVWWWPGSRQCWAVLRSSTAARGRGRAGRGGRGSPTPDSESVSHQSSIPQPTE